MSSHKASDVIAWRRKRPITRAALIYDAYRLAERLPERTHVANYCIDRYHFLVAFLAAIIRGQVTCLPNDATKPTLTCVADSHPGLYAIADAPIFSDVIDVFPIQLDGSSADEAPNAPVVPPDKVVAEVYTSGTTGRPVAHKKTWGALKATARFIAAEFELSPELQATIVATVPAQHMYGLETSIMVPLVAGTAISCGRPLYPADVKEHLARVPEPRVLVTTPIHLRALIKDAATMPRPLMIISATADLSSDLAACAERQFKTKVMEIFGCTEAGSFATRRTVTGRTWRTFDEVSLTLVEGTGKLEAAYLIEPVRLNDLIELRPPSEFVLRGRSADMVNVAGKRASLSGLNAILSNCNGVVDGTFYLPKSDSSGKPARLVAIVVAPDVKTSALIRELRQRLDPAFIPRRVVRVPRLPRNEVGKVPVEAVRELLRGGV